MGFDLQTIRFLFDAKRSGVDFTDTLTLGRQNLHVSEAVYRREAARFSLPVSEAAFSAMPYAEGLLESLGARNPCSLDASPYEQATFLADLNQPLPRDFTKKFSVVIDGGTLEHVFDFRQAVLNVASLIKVGGHLISITCANNFLGHGFYQFSPELFYRVFSPENGFKVENLVLSEINADGDWYQVSDPADVHSRVILVNGARTYMMMIAKRTADVTMFQERTPQQSDYHDARWHEVPQLADNMHFLRRSRLQAFVEEYLPRPARRAVRKLKQGLTDSFASPHLKKVRTF